MKPRPLRLALAAASAAFAQAGLPGDIDELRVHMRALTGADIVALARPSC